MNISQKIYTNKYLHKGLEFASEKSPLFVAGTTLALSTFVRPVSILATPKTDKENKKLACIKSIISSGLSFAVTFGLSLPLIAAFKKINKTPSKFMKPDTVKTFSDSKTYHFAEQMFKLGLGAAIAAPKSILNAKLLPKFTPDDKTSNPISFKGLPEGIGRVLDNKGVQEFAVKHKDSNFPMHIAAITDTAATAAFIGANNKNKQIDKKRRDILNKNCAISTGLSIGAGYVVDGMLNKPTEKFINNFKQANKGMKNLDKCVDGIRIAKPTLIMGGIYYGVIPVVSTFFAERIKKS